MPQPYGVRGGWRATFTRRSPRIHDARRFTGHGAATLMEFIATGEQAIHLPDADSPYAAMIRHVLACLTSHADNLIEPASALPALELTLDVHKRLAQHARPTS
jgi:hypothetical protein